MKIRAEISYIGGNLDFKVKYLWFTIFPLKEKKTKKRKKSKPKKLKNTKESDGENADALSDDFGENPEMAEASVETDVTEDAENGSNKKKDKKEKKETLSEKIDKLKDLIGKAKIIWSVSKNHLKKIFTHIYLDDLMIDFIIASDDAYKTAMNYGKINAAVYNAITAVRLLFPIKIKTVDIVCDFERKEPVYDCELKVTVRPATILSAAFGILFGLLLNIKKLMGKSNKQPDEETAVTA